MESRRIRSQWPCTAAGADATTAWKRPDFVVQGTDTGQGVDGTAVEDAELGQVGQ